MRKQIALDYAFRLFKFRPRTKFELYDRLKRKGYTDKEIKKTITYLTESGLLDDEKFAKEWISSRFRKGKSIRLIKSELLQKGVDKEVVERVFAEMKIQPSDELKVIEELIRKKKIYEDLEPSVRKRRLVAFLLRRGFSLELIETALKNLRDRDVVN